MLPNKKIENEMPLNAISEPPTVKYVPLKVGFFDL